MKLVLLRVGLMAFVILVVFTQIIAVYRVKDLAMFPALSDGDLMIIQRFGEIKKRDVVLYRDARHTTHVGRVLACDGDSFDLDEEHHPLVNGCVVSESILYETPEAEDQVPLPLTSGTNEYVVLNDFRSNTEDSRQYGVIRREDVIGKLVFLFRRRGF